MADIEHQTDTDITVIDHGSVVGLWPHLEDKWEALSLMACQSLNLEEEKEVLTEAAFHL